MEKIQIMRHIANIHNRMAQIQVSGDGAILMGDALTEMRFLVSELDKSIKDEEQQKEGTP